MISYHDVILKKFVFHKIILNKNFEKLIWELKFNDYGVQDGEIRYRLIDVEAGLREAIKDEVIKATNDDYLLSEISNFHYDINKMSRGEWVPMHNETGQLSPFEVILWLTQDDSFEGREFVMRDETGREEMIKPSNGLVCFLDTTQAGIYHGVNKLISDTSVISITGGLGRKRDGYAKANK